MLCVWSTNGKQRQMSGFHKVVRQHYSGEAFFRHSVYVFVFSGDQTRAAPRALSPRRGVPNVIP